MNELAVAAFGTSVAGCAAALCGPWRWLQTLPGAAESPAVLDDRACWLPAPVPGTVAMAMRAAGRWDEDAPVPLHRHDCWYRLRFAGRGRRLLRLRGLQWGTEAWVNGRLVIAAQVLADLYEAEVELQGDNTIHLCFRAPCVRRPTTAAIFGEMLGYLPRALPLDAIGPCHPIELLAPAPRYDDLAVPSSGRPLSTSISTSCSAQSSAISDFCTRDARQAPAPLPGWHARFKP